MEVKGKEEQPKGEQKLEKRFLSLEQYLKNSEMQISRLALDMWEILCPKYSWQQFNYLVNLSTGEKVWAFSYTQEHGCEDPSQ